MKNKRGIIKTSIVVITVIFLMIILLQTGMIHALTGPVTSNGRNMTIWDDTDNLGIFYKSGYNITFNASYINTTGQQVNDLCQIQYQNYTTSLINAAWNNMNYSNTSNTQYYNISFGYKGSYVYNINCSNSTFSMNLTENYTIYNTIPIPNQENGAQWINFDSSGINHDVWGCTEDAECYFNFSNLYNNTLYNVYTIIENDINDNLTYSIGENTTLFNGTYSLNAITGVLLINVTNSTSAGINKKIELKVKDTESTFISSLLQVNITSINDAPILYNVNNYTINATIPGNNLEVTIYGIDEEGNLPLEFNITFSTCDVANWSTRNGNPNNCTIWNSTDYNLTYNSSAMFINFTPEGRNDVGSYIINISVTDNGTEFGYNSQRNYTMNFTIDNVNLEPNITHICGQEVTGNTIYIYANETQELFCYINATDVDELANLTFSSNYTWLLNDTNGTYNNYNGSAIINITPTNYQVGNWSVNISVHDSTGLPPTKYDYEIIRVYINNANDSVTFPQEITNFTGYTGNNYTINFNVTDNDLLIPGKNVYNESFNFTITNLTGTTQTWISLTTTGNTGNITTATLTFVANSTILGNTTINLTVTDANNYSRSSTIFTIHITDNNAPIWDENYPATFTLTEGTEYYENLTVNVTDPDGGLINFTYLNYSGPAFEAYYSGANLTGMINFTPTDLEVGFHRIQINATDGKTPTPIIVNYTVNNIADTPDFGAITGSGSSANEDSTVTAGTITFFVQDDDYLIPESQKSSFYRENITLNFTIVGNNENLFNFTKEPSFPGGNRPNETQFLSTEFTPSKSDVGSYTVYLQATDNTGLIDLTSFTITIAETEHTPTILNISNQTTSIGKNYTLQINVTDPEDTNTDAGGTYNFTYNFLSGTDFFNATVFNNTSGLINITFNSSQAGAYHINITANDSTNLNTNKDFWINVYDTPTIIETYPTTINSAENSTVTINISATHTVGDYLNYSIIINGTVRNSTIGTGDGSTNISMTISFNFSDETTCLTGNIRNITLNVTTLNYTLPERENLTNINLTINHTNYPLIFVTNMSNSTAGGSVSYTLSSYYTDLDLNTNTCNNETLSFTYSVMDQNYTPKVAGTEFTIVITNSTVTSSGIFNVTSGGATATESYQLVGNDTYTLSYSNNFSISLSPQVITQEVPVSGGGGGGGGGAVKPVNLKILFPGDLSARKNDQIIIPLTLYNNGQTTLNGIKLTGEVARNGTKNDDIGLTFDKSTFISLSAGAKEYTNLTLDINVDELGKYEITVNATVANPVYSDWGKFFIEIKETNKTDVEQVIIFTEQLLVDNPECAELKEILTAAKNEEAKGNFDKAYELATNAVRACKNAITQRVKEGTKTEDKGKNMVIYLSFSTLAVLFLIFVYHIFNRIKMRRTDVQEYVNYGV